MEQMCENLINIWLKLSVVIKNNRLFSSLTFNEIFVCNLLYKQNKEQEYLTATDVCEQTRLLKSQMNKVLTSLENKALIERFRCENDKRKVYLKLKDENLSLYLEEHQRIIDLLIQLVDQMGPDKVEQTIHLMTELTDTLEQLNPTAWN